MAMQRKKISIIVPCYNASEYVMECWASIKEQTIGIDSLECIFVEDASEDGGVTWDLLREIEEEESDNVIVIRNPINRRPGGARNAGLDYASGEYLLFLDADDQLFPNACENLYQMARQYSADILQFRYVAEYNEEETELEDNKEYHEAYFDFSEEALRTAFIFGQGSPWCWNRLYRLDLIQQKQIRFAEHVMMEEPSFLIPLYFYSRGVHTTDDIYYYFRLQDRDPLNRHIKEHIMDRAEVAMNVFRNLAKRRIVMERYFDVIECYFLRSYFDETLALARQNNISIPLQDFRLMQVNCNNNFPEYEGNPRLRTDMKIRERLRKGLKAEFQKQEELDEFLNTEYGDVL